MKASEARLLKIDDRVSIRLSSGESRVGVVAKIEWPVFTVAILDSRSRTYYRQRRYKNIHAITKADRVPTEFLRPHELPSWLQFVGNEELEIAADFCADNLLLEAETVLRDPRCNQNQLARIHSAVVNRDTPHLKQLSHAVTLLDDFHAAKDKLQKYIDRLTGLRDIAVRVRFDAAPVLNTRSIHISTVS